MVSDGRERPDAVPIHTGEGSRIAAFLAAGAANAALSLAVYQATLFLAGHVAAYCIAYIAGILFAFYAYVRYVFGAPLSGRRFVAFALFYIASGAIGGAVNAALIDGLGWHPRLAIFVTIAAMIPLNYQGSKWCLHGFARGA
jgi:putative flippase GtrA